MKRHCLYTGCWLLMPGVCCLLLSPHLLLLAALCCLDHLEPNTLSMPQSFHNSSSEFNPASSSVVEAELGSAEPSDVGAELGGAFGLAVDRNSQLELLPPS